MGVKAQGAREKKLQMSEVKDASCQMDRPSLWWLGALRKTMEGTMEKVVLACLEL